MYRSVLKSSFLSSVLGITLVVMCWETFPQGRARWMTALFLTVAMAAIGGVITYQTLARQQTRT